MSYSDFTLQTVVKKLQLMLNERTNLFAQTLILDSRVLRDQ
jgi:hypothetical protein